MSRTTEECLQPQLYLLTSSSPMHFLSNILCTATKDIYISHFRFSFHCVRKKTSVLLVMFSPKIDQPKTSHDKKNITKTTTTRLRERDCEMSQTSVIRSSSAKLGVPSSCSITRQSWRHKFIMLSRIRETDPMSRND